MAPRRPAARAFFGDPVGFAESHPVGLVELSAPMATQPSCRIRQRPGASSSPMHRGSGRASGSAAARRFLGSTLNTLDGPEHRERRLLLQPAPDRRRRRVAIRRCARWCAIATGGRLQRPPDVAGALPTTRQPGR